MNPATPSTTEAAGAAPKKAKAVAVKAPASKVQAKAVPPVVEEAVGKKTVAKQAAATPAATKAAAPKRAAAPEQPVKPAVAAKPKAKLVRDSFTMPQADFDLIVTLKDRALGFKRPTKKSELLRAGLQALAGLSADSLKAALDRLSPLKAGRPKKLA